MSNAAVGGAGIVFVYLFFFIVIVMFALSIVGAAAGNAIAGTSGVTGKGSLIGLGVVIGLPLVAFGAYYGRKYWRMRSEQVAYKARYLEQQKIQQAAYAAANTPEAIAARQAEYNAQQVKIVAEKAASLAAYNAANPPTPISGAPTSEKFETCYDNAW